MSRMNLCAPGSSGQRQTRRQRGGRDAPARLSGRQFEPPRGPDLTTHPLVVAFKDRRYATRNGQADAAGFSMADEAGVLHVDRLIDAQAERIIADQSHGFAYPKENAAKVGREAVEGQADAAREVTVLGARDADLKAAEDGLGRRHGPCGGGYVGTLLALFALMLPIDLSAAMWTPLPPAGQWLLALLIGAGMVLCAHQAARRVEELREAHARRDDDPFGYRVGQVALGFALGVPAAVIVGTALWRAAAFASDAQATGGLAHGGAVNVAFALLGLLAFVVAVLAGLAYRHMAPLREVRGQRAKVQEQRATWQQALDLAERTQRQAELTLAYLDEREKHVIEATRHWACERKARVRQRAATVEMRERLKCNSIPSRERTA